jgi:hypothetical protein
VTDGTTCAGTYTVNATPVAGSGPAGSTPPPTTVVTYIGFPQGAYFFGNAGAGNYTVTVTETGPCNPTTDPVVITVTVPNGTDAVAPTFYVTDVLGNILADNDPLTAAGVTRNFGNVAVPEGECGRQDEYYVFGNDICDGFIVANDAVSATAVTTPNTIAPGTQVSTTPDGFGFYLVDAHWSTGTSTITILGRDASGNIANGAAGLQLIMTVPDNVDPVVTLLGNSQFTIPVCATSVTGILSWQVDDLCDQNAVNFNNLVVSFGGATGVINFTGNNYREYLVTFPAAGNYLVSASYTDAFGNVGFIDQVITVQNAAANQPPVIIANAETTALPICVGQTPVPGIIYSFVVTDDCTPIDIDDVQLTFPGQPFGTWGTGAGENDFFWVEEVGSPNTVYFEVEVPFAAFTVSFPGGGPGTADLFPAITYENTLVQPTLSLILSGNQPADIVMPSVNVTIPQCQASVQTTFAISIFDDCDNPVSTVAPRATFSLGGTPITPSFVNAAAGYFEFTRTLTAANNGNLLVARYQDAQNAVRLVDAQIQVNAQPDAFKPVIVYPSQPIFVALDPCGPNTTVVNFQASAHDNCAVTAWTVAINNGGTVTNVGSTYTTSALTPGTYTVTLTATDAAGNVTVETFQIIITKAPAPATSLACVGQINVSVDATPNSCRVAVTPEMVLNGNWGCLTPADFTVVVMDGNTANGNIADGKGLFDYVVTKVGGPTAGFNSPCWGKVLVEDKLAPTITCVDQQIFCYQVDAFVAQTNQNVQFRPVATDNCGMITPASYVFSTHKFLDDCSDNGFILRKWVVTDMAGHTAACEQTIRVITTLPWFCPDPLVELSCKDITTPEAIALAKGVRAAYPHFRVGAIATNLNGVCNYYTTYSDIPIDACGPHCHGNKKVIRTWTVLDWCEGTVSECTQVIKAVDTEAPTFTVKDTMVSTRPWDCTADIVLPPVWELHDNCDIAPTYSVKSATPGITVVKVGSQWRAFGIPCGEYEFKYTAVDCCGNESDFHIITVTVKDRTAPTPVAKQNIVIGLTPGYHVGFDTFPDAQAKLFVGSVDNGSHDNCSPVFLEIRRPTGTSCGNWGLGTPAHNNNGTFRNLPGLNNPVSPMYNANDTDGGLFVKFCCEDLTSACRL